jgi:hypothetical protein
LLPLFQRKTENYASYVANLLDVCDNIPLLKIDHNASFTDEEIKEVTIFHLFLAYMVKARHIWQDKQGISILFHEKKKKSLVFFG